MARVGLVALDRWIRTGNGAGIELFALSGPEQLKSALGTGHNNAQPSRCMR